MNEIRTLVLKDFETEKHGTLGEVPLSYELAGLPLGRGPVVLVNHALTGNSSVAGPDGWWADLIGPGKAIATEAYTILAFNIPGNCYESAPLPRHDLFTVKDVARLFILGVEALGIRKLRAVIGASLGGGIVWQMAVLSPDLAELYLPIATHYKADAWLLAQTRVQELLLSGAHPLHDARIHGMLCYRTPESLDRRFGDDTTADGTPKIVDWLEFHGRRLGERFALEAYKVMTYLTGQIHAADSPEELRPLARKVSLISIDSDLLFPHALTEDLARTLGAKHYTIHSIHGHDAFLMEYAQISEIVKEILSSTETGA